MKQSFKSNKPTDQLFIFGHPISQVKEVNKLTNWSN